jgi:hypothetical protein
VRTDQLETYWTSAHGKALAERGDPGVATCVTCHGDHLVFGVSDPRSPVHKFSQPGTCGSCHGDAERMEPYGLDADVVEEYAGSVHGRALLGESKLASPTCSDCHGSHGAVPPRVHVVGRVCGQCHTVVGKYFDESPHADATARGEMDECASCHGTHGVAEPTADLFVGPGAGHCSTCHRDSDDPAVAVAKKLYDDVNQLDSAIVSAERELEEASAGGLFIQREYGFLDDARSLRGRARSITHTLSAERLADLLHKGQAMVQETHESLAVKRRKLRDRRIFSSIFFGVTLLLAGVLQTYRREVYGGWEKRGVEDGA